MDKEELKKKILTIVRGAMVEADELPFIETTDNIADALIAAGYGDVSEYKEKLKLHRVFVRKDGGDIKVLYGNNEVDEIVKERNEYKHRAEVAEMALENACVVILSSRNGDQPRRLRAYYKAYLEAAEKELAEEAK